MFIPFFRPSSPGVLRQGRSPGRWRPYSSASPGNALYPSIRRPARVLFTISPRKADKRQSPIPCSHLYDLSHIGLAKYSAGWLAGQTSTTQQRTDPPAPSTPAARCARIAGRLVRGFAPTVHYMRIYCSPIVGKVTCIFARSKVFCDFYYLLVDVSVL